jgi:hypothetical protein
MMNFKKLFATEITKHTEAPRIVACRILAARVRAAIPAMRRFFSVISVSSVAKKGFIVLLAFTAFVLDASAESLGRLFHTPEQRALLDNARKTMPMNAGGETQTPSTPDFTLKGVVTRSDGKRSVWINGHLEQDTTPTRGLERNQAQVRLPSGEVKLKVGQSIDPATGRVTENYRRPPPEPVIAKPAPAKAPAAPNAGKTPPPKASDEDSDSNPDSGKPAP